MGSNILLFAWNRSLPGREPLSAQHFREFTEYLTAEKRKGTIESFEAVLLEPHGGTLNGFFLIRGEPQGLGELAGSTDWARHVTRAMLHLDGATVVRGVNGAALAERMALWIEAIPAPH